MLPKVDAPSTAGSAQAPDLLGRAAERTGHDDPAPYREEAREIFRALGIPVRRH